MSCHPRNLPRQSGFLVREQPVLTLIYGKEGGDGHEHGECEHGDAPAPAGMMRAIPLRVRLWYALASPWARHGFSVAIALTIASVAFALIPLGYPQAGLALIGIGAALGHLHSIWRRRG